jgi:hypothetical protein
MREMRSSAELKILQRGYYSLSIAAVEPVHWNEVLALSPR